MELLWTLLSCLVFIVHVLTQTPRNGDIRLAGLNSNSTQGRVEIYYNGSWGTVCDDGFGIEEAIVVCRQIGSTNPSGALVNSSFGAGTGDIMMDDVQCQATETRLEFCRFAGWKVTNCGHNEDIGVICPMSTSTNQPTLAPPTTKAPVVPDTGNCSAPDPNIRLIGPANMPGVGVVQLRRNSLWGGVCDDEWDIRDARVVCRMLCFDPAKALPGSVAFDTYNITQPMMVTNVSCNGTETNITNCRQSAWANNSCTQDEKARVTCVDMDNSPPSRPQPLLECTNGLLTASFSRQRDPYLEEKHLSVALNFTGPCNTQLKTDNDFVSISIPFDECGTQRSYNSTHIIYKSLIKYDITYTIGDISKANTYMVHVQCELPRDVIADKPIVPLTETVTKTAPGEFIVNMHFFRNNSFVTAVTKFPLEIPVGEWLSVALALNEVDENLRLVVPNCYATPSQNKNDPIRYPLFTNKCINDQTVGFFPLNDTWFGYRYQTFKFVQYSQVYIHCDAYICEKEDPSPQCDRSCFPTTTRAASGKRRKRSMAARLVNVSSQTIIIYDPAESNDIVRPMTQISTESSTSSAGSTPTQTVITRVSSTPKTSIQSNTSVTNHVTTFLQHVTSLKPETGKTDAVYILDSGSGSIVVSSYVLFLATVIISLYLFY